MKKVLTLLMVLIASLLIVTACSETPNTSNTSNKDADKTVAGEWKYVGESEDNITYEVDIDLEANGDFEINIEDENRDDSEGSPDLVDAEIKGIYTSTEDSIDLEITSVTGTKDILGEEVKDNSVVSIEYVVNTQDDNLEITNFTKLVPALGDNVVFMRDAN